MTKQLLVTLVTLFCIQFAIGQKASDVLENSEAVKKGHYIFLNYDAADSVIKSVATNSDIGLNFTTIEDSMILLVHDKAINIYVRPLNPLNFSYNTETKIVNDPINEDASNALAELVKLLGEVTPPPPEGARGISPLTICLKYRNLENKIKAIQTKLEKTQKSEIASTFTKLKNLTFIRETNTVNELKVISAEIATYKTHFKNLTNLIEEADKLLKDYDCDLPLSYPNKLTAKFVFTEILKEIKVLKNKQDARLTNLEAAFKLVDDMKTKAQSEELIWCIHIDEIPVKKDEISIYTITINSGTYELSDDNEIVTKDQKVIETKTIRFRKFQRFVPEVSVGTAFTFLKYNSYGTTSDSTGQQYVGTATENTIKNLNITTMINFNYYIPNSPIHPFYQIGVGVNAGIPTILTGFGIRTSMNKLQRLSISGGMAMTWVKELDELSVGDMISGTDDIEKDYKYSAAPKFSPYVGIQYNF